MSDADMAEPAWVHNETGERGATVIQIENGKALWAVALCASFAALGVGLSVFAAYTAQQAAMESRLLLQHVMALEAKQEQ